MKKLSVFLMFLGLSVASYANGDVKFHLGVSGSHNGNVASVTADVYDDYHFVVRVPAVGSDELDASSATVDVMMSNVSALGITDSRSYSKTVSTGVNGVTVLLSQKLSSVYGFGGVTIPVTMRTETESASFNYTISGCVNNEIVGVPSSSADASAVWQLLAAKLVVGRQDEDTHVLIRKGSYFHVGDECLTFVEDADFLQGSLDLQSIFTTIKGKYSITTGLVDRVDVYLAEGSTVALSETYATVVDDVTVACPLSTGIKGFFTTMRDEMRGKSADKCVLIAMQTAVKLVNDVATLVDGKNVPVDVDFTPLQEPKVYFAVTGNDGVGNNVTLSASVFADYSVDVVAPIVGQDELSAESATVDIAMQDVTALGISGKRSYTKTVNTGVKGVLVSLSARMPNLYGFSGATLPIVVRTAMDSTRFTYNVGAMNGSIVKATPSSTKEASAAWQLFATKLSCTTQDADTHILLKKGSYIHYGDEQLTLTDDVDLFKGDEGLDSVFAAFRQKYSIETGVEDAACVYLAKGSVVAISNTTAELNDNMTLTFDATTGAKNFFSDVESRVKGKDSTTQLRAAMQIAVEALDNVIGLVDGKNVPVRIEFVMPGDVDMNGIVNVNDLTLVTSYMKGNCPSRFSFVNADMDNNGTITVNDAIRISQMILKNK